MSRRTFFRTIAASASLAMVLAAASADRAGASLPPNAVVARLHVAPFDYYDLTGGLGAVWFINNDGYNYTTLRRIDPHTNRVTAKIKIPKADWITPGAGALWVSSETNKVYRLDPGTRKVTATISVGANPLASAWVGGKLWVPNIDSNTISVVDPSLNAVSETKPAGNAPLGVLSTPDGVFVSMSNDGAVWRFPPG